MHAVSFPCGKGKVSALKVLESTQDIEFELIGDENTSKTELLDVARQFFLALYGQKNAKTLAQARFNIFKKRTKPPQLKNLPPTEQNFIYHALRAHLQVMIWKAADKDGPPSLTRDLTEFGWSVGSAIMPKISLQPMAPPMLMDIVSCGCSSEGKVRMISVFALDQI